MDNNWNHQSVKANDVQMHFVREGSGPPLLLLHGWPGFWYDWDRTIPALAKHFDCIAVDMRGFGYSEKPDLPAEFGYNDGTLAADILELLNELGLAKVGLIGHNMGALWAQRFVRSHPERVSQLALLAPPYLGIGQRWREPQHGPEFWYQYFHNLDWSHEIIASSRKNIEIYISHFLKTRPFRSDAFTDEDIKEYVDAYEQEGAVEAGFKVFRAVFRGGNQIVLPQEKIITHKTLVLWGEEDKTVPIRWADRLGEYFSNMEFRSMRGCGHYPMRALPEQTNEYFINFFKKG